MFVPVPCTTGFSLFSVGWIDFQPITSFTKQQINLDFIEKALSITVWPLKPG